MGRQKKVSDEAILRATRKAVVEHGVTVSTTVIAESLELSQSALFKRFGTKDELLRRSLTIELPAWLGELERGPDERDIVTQIREIALRAYDHLEESWPVLLAMKDLGIDPFEQIDEEGRDRAHRALRFVVGWFQRALDAGRIARFSPELVGTVFFSAIHALTASHALGVAAPLFKHREDFVDELIELIWYAIRPEGEK